MRVVGGQFRGRRLRAPRGPDTRPATARVRESVFSALGGRVEGARVLDLYAGSGSLGIEALSRGGGSAVFVERSRSALDALRANVRSLGVADSVRVVSRDVGRFVAGHREATGFDIVFADPPWDISSGRLAAILARVGDWINPGGVVVITRRKGDAAPTISGLAVADQRRHGDALIIRYIKE